MTITSDLRGFALVCDEQTKKTLLMAADRIDAENAKLRELVRCLVNAEHPLDRATLIANAAYMLAELGFWEVES